MAETKTKKSGWLNLLVDYGPVLIFFMVYKLGSSGAGSGAVTEVMAVIKAVGAFMAASIVALIVSRWKLGSISPMLWLSTGLIVVFGSMTILFQDKTWIELKPTIIYTLFGAALLIGITQGKPLLRYLLESAFEGLSELGWMKLSRNWGWFFLALAVLNEVLRRMLDFGDWIAAKLWLFLPLTFLFTFMHIPMLLRHGLAQEAESDVLKNPPHE